MVESDTASPGNAPAAQTKQVAMTALKAVEQAGRLFTQGRAADAEVMARQIVKFHPNLADGYNILGAALNALGKPKEAIAALQQAIKRAPGNAAFYANLGEIERLVQDGIAYARSSHGNGEKFSRIDLASFIESLCYDYQDTGKPVSILGLVSGTASTKPHALRRILSIPMWVTAVALDTPTRKTNFSQTTLWMSWLSAVSIPASRHASSIAWLTWV